MRLKIYSILLSLLCFCSQATAGICVGGGSKAVSIVGTTLGNTDEDGYTGGNGPYGADKGISDYFVASSSGYVNTVKLKVGSLGTQNCSAAIYNSDGTEVLMESGAVGSVVSDGYAVVQLQDKVYLTGGQTYGIAFTTDDEYWQFYSKNIIGQVFNVNVAQDPNTAWSEPIDAGTTSGVTNYAVNLWAYYEE